MECSVWDLIIRMTLLINIDYILKWFLIYIYIYMYVCMYVCMHENFNNRVLVGVEFKF